MYRDRGMGKEKGDTERGYRLTFIQTSFQIQ